MRKTKIICTLGPSVDSVEKIKNLILNGMVAQDLIFLMEHLLLTKK